MIPPQNIPTCEVCGNQITGIRVCGECGTPQHEDCFQFINRCSRPGCDQKPTEIVADESSGTIASKSGDASLTAESGGLERRLIVRDAEAEAAIHRADSYKVWFNLGFGDSIKELLLELYEQNFNTRRNVSTQEREVTGSVTITETVALVARADDLTDARNLWWAMHTSWTSGLPFNRTTRNYDTIKYLDQEYRLDDPELPELINRLFTNVVKDFLLARRPRDALGIALMTGDLSLARKVCFAAANHYLDEGKKGAHEFYNRIGDYDNAVKYLALSHRKIVDFTQIKYLPPKLDKELFYLFQSQLESQGAEKGEQLAFATKTARIYFGTVYPATPDLYEHDWKSFREGNDPLFPKLFEWMSTQAEEEVDRLIMISKHTDALSVANKYAPIRCIKKVERVIAEQKYSAERLSQGKKLLEMFESAK